LRKYHLQTLITTSLRFATGGLQLGFYCILTTNWVRPQTLSPTSLEFETEHLRSYEMCYLESLWKAIHHVPGVCNWVLTELTNVLLESLWAAIPTRPWSVQLGTRGHKKRAFRSPF
jgi:hypothetical protein